MVFHASEQPPASSATAGAKPGAKKHRRRGGGDCAPASLSPDGGEVLAAVGSADAVLPAVFDQSARESIAQQILVGFEVSNKVLPLPLRLSLLLLPLPPPLPPLLSLLLLLRPLLLLVPPPPPPPPPAAAPSVCWQSNTTHQRWRSALPMC